jgi:integral membrane protein (TIGR01906 family)
LKVVRIITQWLFILTLPVLLLTASVSAAVNSPWFYTYGFAKYEVSETTGLDKEQLSMAAHGLVSYFNSDTEPIDVYLVKDGEPFRLFNEREVIHLRDVKGLFRLVYILLLGTGLYACVYFGQSLFWWREHRPLAKGLLWGGGLTLALMVVIGVAAAIDFNWFFRQFHLISFANDFWMLDPATDYLIMLFPQGFWFEAAIYCALSTALGAVILGGLGWWYLRKTGN